MERPLVARPEVDPGAAERYVWALGSRRLVHDLGERFLYSNIGYGVLGDLIAKVSGQSFEGYVREHILLPLGMNDSSILIREVDPALLAEGTNVLAVEIHQNARDSSDISFNLSLTVYRCTNAAPSVRIVSPAPNTHVTLPANVEIRTETATRCGAQVRLVGFFVGATKLGEANTPPYSFTWQNPRPGLALLRAQLTHPPRRKANPGRSRSPRPTPCVPGTR